jgi:hypothetical protein
MSRAKLSFSLAPFVDPFGLEAVDEFVVVLAVVKYPCVACSHFSNSSASNEKSGCL